MWQPGLSVNRGKEHPWTGMVGSHDQHRRTPPKRLLSASVLKNSPASRILPSDVPEHVEDAAVRLKDMQVRVRPTDQRELDSVRQGSSPPMKLEDDRHFGEDSVRGAVGRPPHTCPDPCDTGPSGPGAWKCQ